jgi:hypothetical protein
MKKIAVAVLLTSVAVGPAYSQRGPYQPPQKPNPPSCYFGRDCRPVAAPEPSSVALLATGLLVAGGMVLLGRKRLASE